TSYELVTEHTTLDAEYILDRLNWLLQETELCEMSSSSFVYQVCVVVLVSCVVCLPTRDRRQVVDNYVIDVYVVVDTSMFNRWKDWVQETTGEKNESNLNSKTQLFVKNYVSLIFHQANQRFQSLKKHLPYGISLQIVAMSLNVNVPNVNDLTPIATALESFKNCIQPNVTFDHAILMTSKQLTGAESVSYLGRAYVATMCSMTGYSTSIIVDKAFLTSYHLTHELGHNLGAQHDGFNTSASCPQSDSYLMAPVGISSDAMNYSDHPWYFSPCSASDINKYVNVILGMPETGIDIRNCLKNTSVSIPEFSNTSDVKAGQEYPADIQCQILYGKSSRACPDSGPLENICTTMGCVDPTNQFAYNIHFAAEFTSCGPQKWCSMGKCQFDNSAPITTDCPLGDYVTKINGKTCSSAVKETPSLCNYDEVKKNCCKSCKDISSGNPSSKLIRVYFKGMNADSFLRPGTDINIR
ncbi:hypothetical protein Btru_076138, partial [Bulinus truncatus]